MRRDRLTLTAEAGVVVIRRDPSGLVTLPLRSCVPIPAALRHRCGLLPGDPVLLTAVPAEDSLTAYSLAVVDQALRALIPFPAREGALSEPAADPWNVLAYLPSRESRGS